MKVLIKPRDQKDLHPPNTTNSEGNFYSFWFRSEEEPKGKHHSTKHQLLGLPPVSGGVWISRTRLKAKR